MNPAPDRIRDTDYPDICDTTFLAPEAHTMGPAGPEFRMAVSYDIRDLVEIIEDDIISELLVVPFHHKPMIAHEHI